MRENSNEEQVTVVTDNERIEGVLFYADGIRLSDSLNSSMSRDSQFLKIKEPVVYCRRSGTKLTQAPFLMIAREKIVMIMTRSGMTANNRAIAIHRIIDSRFIG